ncbi:MAG: hypothetical protein AAGJ56_08805 [Myxococcota bacterium]
MQSRLQSAVARASEEFVISLRRALRRGELDISELLDCYVDLEPSGHRHLGNPRKVSLETLSDVLRRLPALFTHVHEVRLVLDLGGFEVEPLPGSGSRSGVMPDGSLLIEMPHGASSVVSFVSSVCALTVEWGKIQSILGSRPRSATADYAPESAAEAVAAAGIDGATPERELPPQDAEVDLDAEHGVDRDPVVDAEATAVTSTHVASGADPGDDGGTEAAAHPVADVSELAFELGVDERALMNASAATRGVLYELLSEPVSLPRIRTHADLDHAEYERRGTELGRRLAESLVAQGLQGRPIHIWLGSDVLTDCLSPYARELREALLTWARSHPDRLGSDLSHLPQLVDESTVYAVMRDFFRNHPEVENERREADATVGIIQQRIDTVSYEWIDLRRIESSVFDARILHWQIDDDAIMLRIAPPAGGHAGAMLQALLQELTPELRSITALLEGTLLQASSPAAIVLPQLLIEWAGERKVNLPGVRRLAPEDFMGLAESSVTSGAVLSMPTATLLNAEHIEALARSYRVAALALGGSELIQTLNDALWSGRIDPEVPIAWALINDAHTAGRPAVASLTAASAVAIALLRQIGAPPHIEAPPEPEPEKPRPMSRTAFRIRA